ncbi:ribonuclease HII [Patescibacteria group bacterium]|nr:ribonuclease HII [Patescibacteria group bacterium]MBU2068593.1 ribonuclease HII [Patescibacteria group bacterium]
MPFSYLEKKILKQGYQFLAGIDEVGRGPLAGPVTAAIVMIRSGIIPKSLRCVLVRDSKQLSVKQRERVFEIVKQEPSIEWRVSFVQPKTIDKVNIGRATQLAWRRSLNKLNPQPDFLFLDGNQELKRIKIKQKAVIKGDQKIFLVSLASIMAKVSRDKLMAKLDNKYPQYKFAQHKGYGTKLHVKNLRKFGPCQIHRQSFKPIANI